MFIKLILITVLVHSCFALSDYCKIEQNDCDVLHIGCANNTNLFDRYTEGVTTVKSIQPTDWLRNEIYFKFNVFKNQIALGAFNESGFPPAARMKLIKWNDEFEYLANLYTYKIPQDLHLCTLTEDSAATFYVAYTDLGTAENLTKFMHDGIKNILNKMTKKDLPWLSSYFAETEQIGCGFAEFTMKSKFVPGGVKFLSMRCILDTISESRDTYQIGQPCTLCKSTMCDEIFTSLCKE